MAMNMRLRCFTVLVLIFVLQMSTATSQTLSYERPWSISKFSMRAGGFMAVNTTTLGATLGTQKAGYSTFSFENDLDMNRNTYSALLNFNVRLGKHNRIDFSYYNIYRKNTTIIDKDITFGEHIYHANSEITPHLNTNIFRLSYGYSFLSNAKFDIGALLGFHIMAFNAGLDFNGQTSDLSYNDDVKFTAPLPDLGFFGTYAFARRWAIGTELGYFYLKYSDFTGRVLSGSLNLQFKLAEHWGVEAGYNWLDVRVDIDRQRLVAEFDWGYNGPFVNVVCRFGRFKH